MCIFLNSEESALKKNAAVAASAALNVEAHNSEQSNMACFTFTQCHSFVHTFGNAPLQ